MDPQNLPDRIHEVRERLARAALAAGRNVNCVTLLAVGKGQPLELLASAAAEGIEDFGENYLQEALGKIAALQNRALSWHFIGRLQANKTRSIAENFSWVHAVDRLKIAERLAAQRSPHLPPLNVCLEVSLAGEESKGGVSEAQLPQLAQAVAALPRLRLRGLMCLPPQESAVARQRAWFRRLRELQEALNAAGGRLDTLSMGMSADFEAAILEGATIVRLGTVLFGPRA